jgi:tRNA-uridine 2-sulfurtransferase
LSRLLAGMTGGVDSSMAARLLQHDGHEVVGATLLLYPCPREEARVEAARGVCEKLGIEHVTVDARERFSRQVLAPFTEALRAGRVPNPYMLWTAPLLVSALLEQAQLLGCDGAATGHYAGIEGKYGAGDAAADGTAHGGAGAAAAGGMDAAVAPDAPVARAAGAGAGGLGALLPLRLVRAVDAFHDESYYLYSLGQDALVRLRFPLHAMAKPIARRMAMREGLMPLSPLLDDYDPFFLDGKPAYEWAREAAGVDDAPGPVVVLGAAESAPQMRHGGLLRYEPGGKFPDARAADGGPLFVVAKDAASRTLYVGPAALSATESCLVDEVVWTSVEPPVQKAGQTRSCKVKTSWGAKAVPAKLSFAGTGRVMVSFSEARRGVEPGATCVFYSDALVLGGGRIVG